MLSMTVGNVIFVFISMYRRRILITKGLHKKIADYFWVRNPDIWHGILNNRAVVCSNIKYEITFSSCHKARSTKLASSVYLWGILDRG